MSGTYKVRDVTCYCRILWLFSESLGLGLGIVKGTNRCIEGPNMAATDSPEGPSKTRHPIDSVLIYQEMFLFPPK